MMTVQHRLTPYAVALSTGFVCVPAWSGNVRLSTDDGNFVAGDSANFVESGVKMATVSGGGNRGSEDALNQFGACNHAVFDHNAMIGGGACNTAGSDDGDTSSSKYATVGGGLENTSSGQASAVGGGFVNVASGFSSVVSGGFNNTASGNAASIGGGSDNTASGETSSVGGGRENTASGAYSTVPGGILNAARGTYSFAAGRRALIRPEGTGVFFWSDSTADSNSFDIGAANTFNARATGGVRFWASQDPALGVRLAPGATAWTVASDRDLKAGFETVDGREVLGKVVAMPIERWHYKADAQRTPHMGPVAQDFYAAFALGNDDKGIQTVDADGVALAAIQGLHAMMQETAERFEARLAEKDAEIADLRARLQTLAAAADRPVTLAATDASP